VSETKLTRYWVTFGGGGRWPQWCGVTACDWNDAVTLIHAEVLDQMGISEMPPIDSVVNDVDLSTLDEWNVLPNVVRPANWRGVWYPAAGLR
jgi:hypothetical protein